MTDIIKETIEDYFPSRKCDNEFVIEALKQAIAKELDEFNDNHIYGYDAMEAFKALKERLGLNQ